MKQTDMDAIYRTVPPGTIPWNIETPPDALVRLIGTGRVKPCTAIDLGCGTGNYAIYLAKNGFDVVGIDISATAIAIATAKAKNEGVNCRFIVADVLGELNEVFGTFDFAYDWELLHHIHPDQRQKYVENVGTLLNPRGKYLSVCFSEKDPQFGGEGKGKFRTTRLGTVLYFSSEDELLQLFDQYFKIIELRTVKVSGEQAPHLAVYAFMEKGY